MSAVGLRTIRLLVAASMFVCSLALFAPAQQAADDAVRQIVLTWQSDPRTTMTITWRTNSQGVKSVAYYTSDESVEIGDCSTAEAETYTFPGTAAWLHSVELTGLDPGATYWVTLETDASRSDRFSFRTAPQDSEDLVFIMGTDAQDVRTQMDVIRALFTKVAEEDPAFFAYSGDFVNAELSDEEWDMFFDAWHETMITPEGRRVPIVPVAGNHEVVGGYNGSKDLAPFYFKRLPLPEPEEYYALQYGPDLSILALNSNHTSPVDGAQLVWLERTLEDHKNSRWIVAHYHDGAWWGKETLNAKIRTYWVPLFERYGVVLAHSGHTHSYRKVGPLSGLTRAADEVLTIVEEGLARAKQDFVPGTNYAPPLQRNLLKLTRGDWQGTGYSSLTEGLKAMSYMLALYVIQTGQGTRERVYDQVCGTQLHADYWAPVLSREGLAGLADEHAGVLYLVGGSMGGSDESPYHYTRVTINSAVDELTVVTVFCYPYEGRWEEGEAFTRKAP